MNSTVIQSARGRPRTRHSSRTGSRRWASHSLPGLNSRRCTACPALLDGTFEEARKAQVEAAQEVKSVGVPEGTKNNSDGRRGKKTQETQPGNETIEEKTNGTDSTISLDQPTGRGENPGYLLGRLKRDAANDKKPEKQAAAKQALDDYVAGKHPSVRAAARAAGIVQPLKPENQVATWAAKSTDLGAVADRLLEKVPPDRLIELLVMIFERLPPEASAKLAGWLKRARMPTGHCKSVLFNVGPCAY